MNSDPLRRATSVAKIDFPFAERIASTAVTHGFAKVLVSVMLAVVLGGHWLVLQSVAWAGMIVTYSQDAPLTAAISMTFDGAHPCKLCKAVEEGKRSGQKQDLLKFDKKLDLFCAEASGLQPPARAFTLQSHFSAYAPLRVEPPPGPPPRVV